MHWRLANSTVCAISRRERGLTERVCGVQGLNEDANMVQTATGEKVGQVLHHLATFVGGIIIGFIKGWRLALVSSSPAVCIWWALMVYTTLP